MIGSHLPQRRPLRCRLGLHKRRPRLDAAAWHTFVAIGVDLKYCELCNWRMKAIGEA